MHVRMWCFAHMLAQAIQRIAQQQHTDKNAPESIHFWMGDIFQNIKVRAEGGL